MAEIKRKRVISDEQKAAMAAGRRKALEKKRLEKQKAAATITNNNTENTVETSRPREIAEDKAQRPHRIPLAKARNTTDVEHIPDGYVARWTNDVNNRIQERLERGYVFAFDDPNGRRVPLEVGETRVDAQRRPGTVVSKVVEMTTTGPLVAYLMLQRKEWYDEDQKYKEGEIKKVMEEQHRKNLEQGLYLDK